MKKTLVVGASTNPSRYSNIATKRLISYEHEVVPIGIKTGQIEGLDILDLRLKPYIASIDTISLYLNSKNQIQWQSYLLSLKPLRIIFNPGTENRIFAEAAKNQNIEVLYACTLVMLSARNY